MIDLLVVCGERRKGSGGMDPHSNRYRILNSVGISVVFSIPSSPAKNQ